MAPASSNKYPPAKGPQPGGFRAWWIIAGAAVVLVAVGFGYILAKGSPQPATPLPTSPSTKVPKLPVAPALPQVKQPVTQPKAPALPTTNVKPPPPQPVTKAPPPAPPKPPAPTGTLTWKWMLYPVNASVLGVPMGQQMKGYQFVALGVTIYNQTNIPVAVDNNSFTVTIDGLTYDTGVWSTSSAVVQGLPFLTPATMQPGSTMAGFTGFMIPAKYSRVEADWHPYVPSSIKIVRIDPPSARQSAASE